MLDLLLSVSLIACALAWAWFGVESLRRRTLEPTRPESYSAPLKTRTSLLGAGLCAAGPDCTGQTSRETAPSRQRRAGASSRSTVRVFVSASLA